MPEVSPASQPLSRELSGDLPCCQCAYNLRGLSIRGNCPECGTPVRATILVLVDPHAEELRPIRARWLVATGVVLWGGGAFAAAAMAWLTQIGEALRRIQVTAFSDPVLLRWSAVFVVLSAIGGATMIRPHAGIAVRKSVMATLGVLLYFPLAWLVWASSVLAWDSRQPHYLDGERPDPEWAKLRLAQMLLVAAIVMFMRPSARLLVARSLVLRSGRVDRQTLAAVAVCAILAAVGDGVAQVSGWLSPAPGDVVLLIGTGVLAVGSVLLTLGLGGVMIDSVRVARAIVIPPPSRADVIGPDGQSSGSDEA